MQLIESTPSASAESWREENLAEDKETVAGCDSASSGSETDINDQPSEPRLLEDN